MLQLPVIIRKTLSVRIALMVVSAMAVLLMASMVVILIYSRNAVKDETFNKAIQTLESTNMRIDNILLSVEQTTGNIFFSMMPHLDNPDMIAVYSRKLVEANPYVAGCAIAFKEDYFKEHRRFMAYVHHADSAGKAYVGTDIVDDDMFGNSSYTEQVWYTRPMATGKAAWLNPLVELVGKEAPIITYSLPIYKATTPTSPFNEWKTVGVIGVDVSLSLLSKIVSDAKPSPNSYCTLLDSDSTFIVHPDDDKLRSQTMLLLQDQSARDAALAMLSGRTGYQPFSMQGQDYYLFYKPFQRTGIPGIPFDSLTWSAGIIYPKADVYGQFNQLTLAAIVIAICSLLLLYALSRLFIHRQLLPLDMLSDQAQHIADGQYNTPIPVSDRPDEVGRLQNNFSMMQQSLANNIGELEHLTATLEAHSDSLRQAYAQAQKADRMKTAFLHNMTNQMIAPAEAIEQDITLLCDSSQVKDKETASRLVTSIQQHGDTIAQLLKNLLNISDEEKGKEVADA
jgi:HAMP domain-containing protein